LLLLLLLLTYRESLSCFLTLVNKLMFVLQYLASSIYVFSTRCAWLVLLPCLSSSVAWCAACWEFRLSRLPYVCVFFFHSFFLYFSSHASQHLLMFGVFNQVLTLRVASSLRSGFWTALVTGSMGYDIAIFRMEVIACLWCIETLVSRCFCYSIWRPVLSDVVILLLAASFSPASFPTFSYPVHLGRYFMVFFYVPVQFTQILSSC